MLTMETKPVQIRLSEAAHQALRVEAVRRGCTHGELIERLLVAAKLMEGTDG